MFLHACAMHCGRGFKTIGHCRFLGFLGLLQILSAHCTVNFEQGVIYHWQRRQVYLLRRCFMTQCSPYLQPICVHRSILIIHFRIQRGGGIDYAVDRPADMMDVPILVLQVGQFCNAGVFLLICAMVVIVQGPSILGYPGLIDLYPVYCLLASVIEAEGLRKAWKGGYHKSHKRNSICYLLWLGGIIVTDERLESFFVIQISFNLKQLLYQSTYILSLYYY
jgi:hypothetical protein